MDSTLYIPDAQQSIARNIPVLFDGSLPNNRMGDLKRTLLSTIIEPENLKFFEAEVAAFRESFFSLKDRRGWLADQERQSREQQLSHGQGQTPSGRASSHPAGL